MNFLRKIFKPKAERDFKRYEPAVEAVSRYAAEYEGFTEEQFQAKTAEFRERVSAGETLDDLLEEAFGLVKAGCQFLVGTSWDVCGLPTKWEMVPYDVQLVGGMVLHGGNIAEMATGEGKTLVATMPLYLNALSRKGAHLVTVNDYLARRDSEWMGRLYNVLGLSVGVVQSNMDNEARKTAYACDGTNNEFGFDYLRDNMATRVGRPVQRGTRSPSWTRSTACSSTRREPRSSSPVPVATTRPPLRRSSSPWSREPRSPAAPSWSTSCRGRGREDMLEERTTKTRRGSQTLLAVQRGAPKNKRLMKL